MGGRGVIYESVKGVQDTKESCRDLGHISFTYTPTIRAHTGLVPPFDLLVGRLKRRKWLISPLFPPFLFLCIFSTRFHL